MVIMVCLVVHFVMKYEFETIMFL